MRNREQEKHIPGRGGSLPASRLEMRMRTMFLTTEPRPVRTNTPWTIPLTTPMMVSGDIPAESALTAWSRTVANVFIAEIRRDTGAGIYSSRSARINPSAQIRLFSVTFVTDPAPFHAEFAMRNFPRAIF